MKKINKILAIILAILMVISIVPFTAGAAAATSGTCGENLTWNFDTATGTLTITGYGPMTDFAAGWKVPWNTYDSKILKIEIDERVTSIGNWSFWLCEKITELDIPDNVTRIGDYAIGACYKLNNVTIPDGVKTIGYEAFTGCISFTNVTFPDSVVSIGARAFEGCNKLTEVFIPKNIEEIGKAAFSSCDSLTKITVDNNNPNYSSDEYGVLFNKDKTILMQYPCGRTEEEYLIPEGVKTIQAYAFYSCENIKEITIPESVTTIEDSAFFGCENLKEITIPESVTTIEAYAFWKFTTILYYGGTAEQWKQLLADNSDAAERLAYYIVHCSDETIYPSGSCGENLTWKFDITTGTLTISGSGYMNDYEYDDIYGGSDRPWDVFNYQYIKNIVIDDGVSGIGYEAFFACDYLESVTIGSTVTFIDVGAFAGCDKLTDVYYFGTETEWNAIEIGNRNSSLINANIRFEMSEDVLVSGECGENLTWTLNLTTGNLIISGNGEMSNPTWGEYSDKITNVIIEKKYTGISLGGVPLNYGATSISDGAFSGCEKLKNITIPDTVKTIGVDAFADCKNLTRINIPDSVTVVGGNAFKNCTKLEKAFIGSGITTIEDGLFYNCADLKEVTMTVNVTAIDLGAFYGCGELKDVYYSGSEENWNNITIGLFNDRLNIATIHYLCFECKHEYISGTIAPTCTKQGYRWHHCSLCDDYYTDEYVNPTGHTYDSGVTVEPTCTVRGYITYTCTACDNFYREYYGEPSGHKYETVVTAPTCTEQGFTTYTCTVCDYSTIGDNTEATGHSVDSWEVTAQPTCTKVGTEKGICTVCDEEVVQTIKSLGHDLGELTVEYEATCTKDGRKSQQCSRCGSKKNIETIPATGHNFGDWIEPEDAVCGQYCRYESYCSKCGFKTVKDAKPEHKYESTVTAPTCTEMGYTTYTCKCGDTYVSDYVDVDTNKHSFTSKITTPATHTTNGVITYTCLCGNTYTEETAKTPEHTYNSIVTAPTCTEKGYTTYTCECGDSYVDDYVDVTGHTYKAVETAPTCTEKGYITYTCECGNSYVEDIDSTGHNDIHNDGICDNCGTKLCDHDCHKEGFAGFLWRIINVFNMLFGLSKTCECGANHF